MRAPAAVVPVVVVFVAIPASRVVFVSATLVHVATARPNVMAVAPGMMPADPDIPAPWGVVLLDRRRRSVAPAVDHDHGRESRWADEPH